jgi:TolB-like protein/tRNA A-37 threonylcarbamoyl transferase component Bud32/Tfp pilus assembly protein PilF
MPESSGLATALADRYVIERELGTGGMATVYAAQDLKHQRRVAVKVLRPDVAAALGAERFLREITTTASLRHPHILPLYDSGEAGGFLFYVMPCAEGESLRDRLERERQLPLEDALQITREVADALAYAHGRGVIHRDIKPENILLESGHAVVADFGIARALDAAGAGALTQTGMAVGTPAYMSPEQASGEKTLDGRSDLYALGCVLYEMLAGQPPFTGATAESIVYQQLAATPRGITEVRPGVPAAVAAALARLLAKTPADRPGTGMVLIEALRGAQTATPVSVAIPAPERSIAVLPFTNMSADPENEFFADGIAEEIINALTKLPGLRVAARTSAFSFKGKTEDLRAIGEKLGVTNVLEGSVRKAGNRLRITAQLISVADGYHAWSERYDRELHDIFAIQDEIAAAVVERFKLTLDAAAGSLVQAGTASVEAYQLYLKGRALLYRRGPNIETARECFEQAVTLDPQYALAHAGLADALNYLAMWGVRRPSETIPQAREATRRALALAPDLAEAHYARAVTAMDYDYDAETSGREFARAVELSPGYIQGRCGRALYDLCFVREDHAAALAEADHAVRDDPLSAYAVTVRAMILTRLNRMSEAVAEARRATELDPDSIVAWWQLQCITGWAGDHAASVRAGETAVALSNRFTWPVATLAAEHGRAGDRPAAEALYRELCDRASAGYVQPTILAIAAVGCGRLDEALGLLRRAAEEHDFVLPGHVRNWPDLEPARRLPGYRDVLARMGWS